MEHGAFLVFIGSIGLWFAAGFCLGFVIDAAYECLVMMMR